MARSGSLRAQLTRATAIHASAAVRRHDRGEDTTTQPLSVHLSLHRPNLASRADMTITKLLGAQPDALAQLVKHPAAEQRKITEGLKATLPQTLHVAPRGTCTASNSCPAGHLGLPPAPSSMRKRARRAPCRTGSSALWIALSSPLALRMASSNKTPSQASGDGALSTGRGRRGSSKAAAA